MPLLSLGLLAGCGNAGGDAAADRSLQLIAGTTQTAQVGDTLRADVREPARAASQWHLTHYDSFRLEFLGITRHEETANKGRLRRYRLLARRPGRVTIVLKDSLPNTHPPVETRRYHLRIHPLEPADSASTAPAD